MTSPRTSSILAADFGSVTTRVVLFDVVDGEYRIVARRETPSTASAPYDDVNVAFRRMLRDMNSAMQRTFTDKDGKLIIPEGADRSGVDLFVSTASVGRPMRAVMVNILAEGSHLSALRAISASYVDVVAVMTLADSPDQQDQLNTILLSRPDIVFFAGGTNGGPTNALIRLANSLKLALEVMDASIRPTIIYAGNNKVAAQIEEMLKEYTTVYVANNVMPSFGVESPESALAEVGKAYDLYKERYGEGFKEIGSTSATGVLPTAQTYELIAQYFAEVTNGNVLVADMGSSSTVLFSVINKQLNIRISTAHGLGHSAKTMLDTIGVDAVRHWLPMYISDSEITHYALNKTLRPATVPMTLRDAYLEHGFLRAGLRHLVESTSQAWADTEDGVLPSIHTIIAGGAALTKTGKAGYNLLLIADTLQPSGVTLVYADAYGIVPAIGSLARVNTLAAVQLLDGGNLDLLGTLISLNGTARADRNAAKMTIKTGGEKIDYELKGGQVLFLPIPLGYTIELNLRCQNGMSVDGKSRIKLTVQGGSAGVLIDGRGRTFDAGNTVEERAASLPRWIHAATDDPLQEIPAEWLVPIVETVAEVPVISERDEKRRARRQQQAAAEAPTELSDEDELMSLLRDDPAPKATQTSNVKAVPPKQTAPLPDLSTKEVPTAPSGAGAQALKKLGKTPAKPLVDDDDDLRGLL
jgi:hypothetical protein